MKVFKLIGDKQGQSLFSFKGVKTIYDDGSPRNDLQTAMAVIQWLLPKQEELVGNFLLWDNGEPILWDNGEPIPMTEEVVRYSMQWDNGKQVTFDNNEEIIF